VQVGRLPAAPCEHTVPEEGPAPAGEGGSAQYTGREGRSRRAPPPAQVAIYVDYRQDESYTPQKLSIRAGNSFHDLREIKSVELEEPTGWQRYSLVPDGGKAGEVLRAYFVQARTIEHPEAVLSFFVSVSPLLSQLAVLSNHQNGRDTHIRQVKIFGPRQLRTPPQWKLSFRLGP
jgi:hypothetical protein